MINFFDQRVSNQIIARINALNVIALGKCVKMNASQMLAHCNVTYKLVYDNIHPKPNAFMRFMMTALIKKSVVSETPYKHNGSIAPFFIIKSDKDFSLEKAQLINYINKAQQDGATFF